MSNRNSSPVQSSQNARTFQISYSLSSTILCVFLTDCWTYKIKVVIAQTEHAHWIIFYCLTVFFCKITNMAWISVSAIYCRPGIPVLFKAVLIKCIERCSTHLQIIHSHLKMNHNAYKYWQKIGISIDCQYFLSRDNNVLFIKNLINTLKAHWHCNLLGLWPALKMLYCCW